MYVQEKEKPKATLTNEIENNFRENNNHRNSNAGKYQIKMCV